MDDERRAEPCCAPEDIADRLHDANYEANQARDKAGILFPYIVDQMRAMMDTLDDPALKSMIDEIEDDLENLHSRINDIETGTDI